jgi:Cof subfamily protein (haloacid dehalogenase superfamily)
VTVESVGWVARPDRLDALDLLDPLDHMIRLIAIDVDGTLLGSDGRVPPENVEAIADAAARGVRVVIVTGRSFYFALPAVSALPDPLLLIVHNGAITRARSGETLTRRMLTREVARAVLGHTRAWRHHAALLFDRPLEGQMVYDRLDWTHPNRSRFKARNEAIIQQVASLEDALGEDPIQVTFNGNVQQMRALIAELAAFPQSGELSVSLTEYPSHDFSLVDVCCNETTKGISLARLAAALGIARDEVLAVGDNHNDRDMLEWAGTGVVMGNADPELLAIGLPVTGTNDEAGLAQAIRRFADF